MKRILSIIGVFIALVALVLVPASAYATPDTFVGGKHIAVSGEINFGAPIEILVNEQIGGYTVYTDILDGTITGDVDSSEFIFVRTLIIRANGDFDVTGTITGTCTVFGKSGGFTQRITATGSIITGAIQGQWTILGGTGELEGLNGYGTFSGIVGQASDYSGKFYFDTGRGKNEQ